MYARACDGVAAPVSTAWYLDNIATNVKERCSDSVALAALCLISCISVFLSTKKRLDALTEIVLELPTSSLRRGNHVHG